ncbi:MAG: glycerol-3-phosphate 1-O-acyltransferase PlsY [Rhizobiales bacterium]|nr:glycerol-3-phosphate 1-O-acyltransferase PlsY [Hyphomicrobiales bacterium]
MELSVQLGLVAILAYLAGSIPFGLVLTRLAGLGDIRAIGSGNIGATNVLRTGRKGLAAATLLLDAAKGTLAVLLAPVLALGALALVDGAQSPMPAAADHMAGAAGAVAGVMAFLGHCFPVWLGFRGGKGVATFIGVLLGWTWPAAVGFCALWLAVAAATRYSSLAALVSAALAPVLVHVLAGQPLLTVASTLLSLLLVIRHRANIERLLAGTESRIGGRS